MCVSVDKRTCQEASVRAGHRPSRLAFGLEVVGGAECLLHLPFCLCGLQVTFEGEQMVS